MVIKTKKTSAIKLQNLLSTCVACICTVIITISSSMLFDKVVEKLKKEYNSSIELSLSGYTDAFSQRISNYKNYIENIYDSSIFPSGTNQEIKQYLKSIAYKKGSDIEDIFFFDKNGFMYSLNKDGINVSTTDYYRQIINEKSNSYVSGLYLNGSYSFYYFIVAKIVYSSTGEVKGGLGVSVKADTIQEKLENIKTVNSGVIALIDQNGKFISHTNKFLIGQVLDFADQKEAEIQNLSSKKIAAAVSDGKMLVLDENETEVVLSYKTIPGTRWKIAFLIPNSKQQTITNLQKLCKFVMVFISVFSILLLMFLESRIMDSFQKHNKIIAVYDSQTNLWTREKFEAEAAKLIKRNPKAKFMFIESDIKSFKFINQNYGEEAADYLIKYFGNIISTKFPRKWTTIFGRGYGDHFFTFTKIPSVKEALDSYKKVFRKIEKEVQSYEIPFYPKWGISFLLPDTKHAGLTIQALNGQATFAKSIIKGNSEVNYAIYDSKMLHKITQEQNLESQMEKGIKNHEFFVMYQPKISLTKEKIVGAEALVRWRNEKYGLLPPNSFIPLFEKNGFVKRLDFYVYEEVFKYLQNRLDKNLPVVPISVNMSRNHDNPKKFMTEFMEIFNRYNIPANLVQVEILERSFMGKSTLGDITDLLHEKGFSVAMDDFGSGESSLNMLTKIPIDVLKFDREFLLSSSDEQGRISKKNATFIKTLIDLSKSLDKETVFEGVETEVQRDFLKSIDCDEVQGFFYSRPLIEEDFSKFVDAHI